LKIQKPESGSTAAPSFIFNFILSGTDLFIRA